MYTSKYSGLLILLLSLCTSWGAGAQLLLKPTRVFDGKQMHREWVVLVEASEIAYAGPESGLKPPKNTEIISLEGMTLLP
ncbi:MAG: hypothetical protein WBN56_07760, partial [Robiginitalea sp.]